MFCDWADLGQFDIHEFTQLYIACKKDDKLRKPSQKMESGPTQIRIYDEVTTNYFTLQIETQNT